MALPKKKLSLAIETDATDEDADSNKTPDGAMQLADAGKPRGMGAADRAFYGTGDFSEDNAERDAFNKARSSRSGDASRSGPAMRVQAGPQPSEEMLHRINSQDPYRNLSPEAKKRLGVK